MGSLEESPWESRGTTLGSGNPWLMAALAVGPHLWVLGAPPNSGGLGWLMLVGWVSGCVGLGVL